MECGFIIEDEDIQRYKRELEAILPSEIDAIASEGGLMVRYSYVPGSIRLLNLIDNGDIDPLTPCWSCWYYQVLQSETRSHTQQDGEIETVMDIRFTGLVKFDAYVEIPIDPSGSLVTDGIDFLLAMETATEGHWV